MEVVGGRSVINEAYPIKFDIETQITIYDFRKILLGLIISYQLTYTLIKLVLNCHTNWANFLKQLFFGYAQPR